MRMRANSLSFRDRMVLRGDYVLPVRPDTVPLSDGAGEVTELGDGVAGLRVGDRVAANISLCATRASRVHGAVGLRHRVVLVERHDLAGVVQGDGSQAAARRPAHTDHPAHVEGPGADLAQRQLSPRPPSRWRCNRRRNVGEGFGDAAGRATLSPP